jgi:hypothetical protein
MSICVKGIGGGCHLLSIVRTRGHSSACGGMRTAAGDYWFRARSHSSGVTVAGADATTAQVHSINFGRKSDRQYRQSQDPGTYCSNTAGHLIVVAAPVGDVEPLMEIVCTRCCRTFAGCGSVLGCSAPCRPALAPGRTRPR